MTFSAPPMIRKFIRSFVYSSQQKQALIDFYSTFLNHSRIQTMKNVLDKRSKFIIPVLEDVRSEQNVAAVVRTVECFGMSNLHIINPPTSPPMNERKTRSKGVSSGATEWIYVKNHKSSEECFQELKDKYNCRIIVTSPYSIPQLLAGEKRGQKASNTCTNYSPVITEKHISLPHYVGVDQVPIAFGPLKQSKEDDKPIALVFGNEAHGISNVAIDHADASLTLPLYGFTESFNIHVSVAISTYFLNEKFRTYLSNPETKDFAEQYLYSSEEKTNILLEWLRDCVSRSDELELEFMRKEGIPIPASYALNSMSNVYTSSNPLVSPQQPMGNH
ncbi:hypothetical protein C9374_010535 [Naegleria lovaniensis]|uniref:tRNA/rRNA methyltransferase SpoU type domain-containing protein n=1 Tax=Naegleria lovaniensis TaxID=51637 RepID=A0AA88GIJ8_NAELO|nr:uncharacterized protein C9374_010535 [Naegleria lovaniensis]KAG2374791.1 hypothetical protein C9374_010535 [Naegleria lovaniensis]